MLLKMRQGKYSATSCFECEWYRFSSRHFLTQGFLVHHIVNRPPFAPTRRTNSINDRSSLDSLNPGANSSRLEKVRVWAVESQRADAPTRHGLFQWNAMHRWSIHLKTLLITRHPSTLIHNGRWSTEVTLPQSPRRLVTITSLASVRGLPISVEGVLFISRKVSSIIHR